MIADALAWAVITPLSVVFFLMAVAWGVGDDAELASDSMMICVGVLMGTVYTLAFLQLAQ